MAVSSPDFSDGCMIALYPPARVRDVLVVPDGLPPEELHVTVVYLGDAADVDASRVRAAIEGLPEREPLKAHVSGHARFTGGGQDVAVALVDSADLEDLRRDLLVALADAGVEVPRDHGYTAHLTQAYLDPDAEAPVKRIAAMAVTFGSLTLVHGTDRTDFPFVEHPMRALAREAFAAGWAASGGPMTERVRAASRVAVDMAVEAADDPGVFEATINLGKLEGMWALLFQRRDQQLAAYTDHVRTAWSALLDPDGIAAGVDAFRRDIGLHEAEQDTPSVNAAALAAATAMLSAFAVRPGWAALRQALRDALTAGQAEGMVNAVALAAERHGASGLDWDAAFQQAYQRLHGLDQLWGDADAWLGRILDRASADVARVLAGSAQAGAPRDSMLKSVLHILGIAAAVAFVLDWALTTAAIRGALDLYASEGATQVDVITAGDARVCRACEAAEEHSPWPIDEAPQVPLHPRCRCLISASLDLSRFANWFT